LRQPRFLLTLVILGRKAGTPVEFMKWSSIVSSQIDSIRRRGSVVATSQAQDQMMSIFRRADEVLSEQDLSCPLAALRPSCFFKRMDQFETVKVNLFPALVDRNIAI
jgi:hypothetical protein